MFTVDQIKEAAEVLKFEARNDFSGIFPDSNDPIALRRAAAKALPILVHVDRMADGGMRDIVENLVYEMVGSGKSTESILEMVIEGHQTHIRDLESILTNITEDMFAMSRMAYRKLKRPLMLERMGCSAIRTAAEITEHDRDKNTASGYLARSYKLLADVTDPNTGVPVKSYFVDDIVKKYLELPPKE